MEEHRERPFIKLNEITPRFMVIGETYGTFLMAERLVMAGQEVCALVTNAKAGLLLASMGVKIIKEIADEIAEVNVVVTLLDDPDELNLLYVGPEGLLTLSKPGTYFIDMSALDISLSEDIFAMAAVNDQHFLDAAPVYPLVIGDINNADLACGGLEEDFEVLGPVLEVLENNALYVGTAGRGTQAHLCNIIATSATVLGIIEACELARMSDTNSDAFTKLLTTQFDGSLLPSRISSDIEKEVFHGGETIGSVSDKLSRALEMADAYDLTLPFTEMALHLFDLFTFLSQNDYSIPALALLYEDEDYSKKFGLDWNAFDELINASMGNDGEDDPQMPSNGFNAMPFNPFGMGDSDDDSHGPFPPFSGPSVGGFPHFFSPN